METWQDVFAVKTAAMHLTELWTLQEDDNLQGDNLKPGWKKFVQRRALGRFQCSQCSHEWSSAKVHILFHMCHYTGWGMVRMRVFRQACRRCPNPPLEEPKFSQETMEKVLHNLVLKIFRYCYRVSIQPSDLLEVVVDAPVVGPHDSTHCEGCQLGICSESRPAPASDVCEPVMDVDKIRTNDTHHSHQTHHMGPASYGCEPVMDVDEIRTNDTHHSHQIDHMTPTSYGCEPVMDVDEVRTNDTHHTHQTDHMRPPSCDWESVMDVDEVRTNYTHHIHQTQHTRPAETPTHHPLPFNINFPWERCCCCCSCSVSSLLCILTGLIFLLLHFTK